MFSIECLNPFDPSHILIVNGTNVPFNDNTNVDNVVLNFNAGETVTAYVSYNSADFVCSGWTIDSMSHVQTDGSDLHITDTNGQVFNSSEVAAVTVAGAITENRIRFIMPSFSFGLAAFLLDSDTVGLSPETRVDLNGVNEIEFDGENVSKLFIDGTLRWDASMPDGQKYINTAAGITFLIED